MRLFSPNIFFMAAFCIILLLVVEAAALSHKKTCNSMRKSVDYMCPGSHCPSVKAALDEAVHLNWKLMVALSAAEKRIEELEQNCNGSHDAREQFSCERGLLYGDKCYTVILTNGFQYDMNYQEAIAQCSINGSLPAEIRNRDEQAALEEFLRTKIPSGRNIVEIWTGMKYNISTSSIVYKSGVEKPLYHLSWAPRFPVSTNVNTNIAIYVRSPGWSDKGVWNYRDLYDLHGVLCERDV